MYKIILALLMLTGTVSYATAANVNQKVDICHLTGQDRALLQSVGIKALSSHLQHGDVLPGDPVPGVEDKTYDEVCNIVDTPVVGPSIIPGAINSIAAAGVLWRGKGPENEILIGIPDITVSDNRNDLGKLWNNTTHRVTFNWDKRANAISSTVDGVAVVYDFDIKSVQPQCLPANWDTMTIILTDDAGGPFPNVSLGNITLGGFPLGGLVHSSTGDSIQNWTVGNFDFTESFTFSADILIEGTWDNSESTSVGVIVGCL